MKYTHVDIMKLNAVKFSSCRDLVHSPHVLAHCYCSFLFHFLYRMVRFKWKLPDYKELLFVAPSLNNKKSLEPICINFPKDSYTMLDDFGKQLPFSKIYFFSMFHLIDFHRMYRSLSQQDKLLVRYFFYDFVLAYGTYVVINQLLRKKRVKVIVFANDHIMVNRCFIELAALYKIKTLYTQHASVTESFPSLLFSYSFLDGLDSYNKYKLCGNIAGKVLLSGSPRFDIISKLRKDSGEAIGIAVNELDSIDILKELCAYLSDNLNEKIIIRLHPSMERMSVWNDFTQAGYGISYPTKENSFEFVAKIRLLVANESGIHLDSNLMKTPSVLYNFSTNPVMDWYSYVKNGLMPICFTKEDLLKYIQNGGKINAEKIRYYNAAFATPYEGKVGTVISGFIKCMLRDTEMSSINGIFGFHENGYYCYV